MGSLFSKKEKSKVSEQDLAILQLKTSRDKIRQYQKRSEATLEKDRLLAKKLLQENKKERAKLILRKKKFIEEQLKKTDGQLENLEKLIQDIEVAQIEMKVIDSLKAGKDALKHINDVMSIEDIEKILDETQEAVEKQQEIDALLSGGLSSIEETEVEDELSALIADSIQKQLPETPSIVENPDVVLPDVPESELEVPKEKEKEKEKIAETA